MSSLAAGTNKETKKLSTESSNPSPAQREALYISHLTWPKKTQSKSLPNQ